MEELFQPTEIVEGLYQLKTPMPEGNPLGFVLPYLFVGDGDCLLIDSGWDTPESFDALRRQLDGLGLGLRTIRRLAVTHVHPDHYGLAGHVRRESGAQLFMHERDRSFIRSRYLEPDALLKTMAGWLLAHGVPQDEMTDIQSSSMPLRAFVAIAEPDHLLHGGEVLEAGDFRLEVIWTPGHSPGHICFYERRRRLLLTGDHVLPTITPNVSFHPEAMGNPLGDYLTSLRALEHLDVEKVLPAHEYAFADLRGRLREIEEHHQFRLSEMMDALSPGGSTAYEVARGVTWATGSYDSFSPWMKRAALGETLAHLEYLVEEGRVLKSEEGGVVRFRCS